MKNWSYNLERLELVIDVVLKWFVLVLLLLGLVATTADVLTGQEVVASSYLPLFEDILWSVVAIGLIILWREVRQLRQIVETGAKHHRLPAK